MTKNYLRFPFLVTSCKLFFQEACFLAGNNFMKYTFQISNEAFAMQFQTVASSTYGKRYSIPFNITK